MHSTTIVHNVISDKCFWAPAQFLFLLNHLYLSKYVFTRRDVIISDALSEVDGVWGMLNSHFGYTESMPW